MNTILLISLIEAIAIKQDSTRLSDLALQIAVDPELPDEVTIESFSTEYYDAQSINNIKQCLDFELV